MNFDLAFERLIGHEGTLSDHPNDPGGLTKFGVSQRSYPGENIRDLTLARAKEIYRRDFWDRIGGDHLQDVIRFDLFDMAVNSGVSQAVKTLQRAVGTKEDGLLGTQTLLAVQGMSGERVLMRFNAARLLFMTNLSGWQSFGRGWARRVAENMLGA